jgi:transitional endoplasmic reticulum ATPase
MRFLFNTYKQHHDVGLAAHQAGDMVKARMHYLMAAKYLCALAKDGEVEFKSQRLKKAGRLMEMAKGLEGPEAQRPKGAKGKAEDRSQKAAGVEDESEAKVSRWVVSNPPDTRFKDVAGLEDVKRVIDLRVIQPLRNPALADRFKKKKGGGVLLYGPPGTGKTLISRAIACELDATFFSIKCSDIMSKWVGSAEKNIQELFAAARNCERSVIFMDETEAIIAKRGGGSTVMNRVIPEFLAQVDGLERHDTMLLLLGATNRPWDMDDAALRPGRFDALIYVPLPDQAARQKMIELNLREVPMADDIELAELAQRLEGYSGADIKGFSEAVTDAPYQRQIETGLEQVVMPVDIDQALERVRPSVDDKQLDRYGRYREGKGGSE